MDKENYRKMVEHFKNGIRRNLWKVKWALYYGQIDRKDAKILIKNCKKILASI